jgi:Domain of unknown function (DUF4167)
MSAEQSRRAASFAARSKRWTPRTGSSEPKGSQNAQRSYERYLALAGAASLTGDTVGAENFYQHAEHFFRSMSSGGFCPILGTEPIPYPNASRRRARWYWPVSKGRYTRP